jgi:hypothetical protein
MTLAGSDDEAILAALNIIFEISFTKESRRLLGPCPEKKSPGSPNTK